MGENFGFWFPQQQVNWKISNFNSLAGPFPSRQENPVPPAMKPISSPVSMNGELPVDGYPDISNQPHGWFYCLPRFRQAFMPSSDSSVKEHHLQAAPKENPEETIKPDAGSGSTAQKRFLVFDQTGDQTTLIYSSGIGTPVQCLTSWSSKPPGTYNFTGENGLQKGDVNLLHSGSNLVDILDGSNVNDVQSEMHEDTEELNALLYSDDDDDIGDDESDDDDDEVTSTGHSPNTMTANGEQECFEEVASSFEPTTTTSTSRKRKLFNSSDDDNDDGCYDDVPSSLMVTGVSSSKVNQPQLGNEDDAESSCGNSCYPRLGEIGSSSLGVKRMRKEKICETVSVLRRIIPHGKGKDALVVIDEAIDYLKSLKLVVKEFGLESDL